LRRKKNEEEHVNHERWLISYADFITLLFAFFVVLYATSSKDEEKQKEFQESIRKYLSKMAVGVGEGATDSVGQGDGGRILLTNPLGRKKRSKAIKESYDLQKRVENALEDNLSPEDYKSFIFTTDVSDFGVVLSLSSNAIFNSNVSEVISRNAVKTLKVVASILKKENKKFLVQGHTDSKKVRTKDFASNWELSSVRATKILRFLQKLGDLPEDRAAVMAFGSSRPEEPGNDKRNQRIDLQILIHDDILL